MPKIIHRQWSPVSVLVALNGGLVVLYLALVAAVLTYAALEVEFQQSVKNDEASVATLEASYLAQVQQLSTENYATLGYTKPVALLYVSGAPETALSVR